MAEPILEVRGLHAHYATAHVLFDVGFSIPPDSLMALLGRNGAGKTTTARALMGAGVRTEGSIRFAGVEVARLPTFRRARLGLQLVPEDRRVYTDLTVRQNLELSRHAAGGRRPLSIPRLLEIFPTLEALLERGGSELSGGEQQLVAIARAILPQPRLLIMDEPSQGLAPVVLERVRDAVRLLRAEFGTTVLLTEQNVPFALGLADLVMLIDEGSVVFSGSRAEFEARPELRSRYLAVGSGA
jgi:ABC-type branched-subunit amino acid transport system ATPase component